MQYYFDLDLDAAAQAIAKLGCNRGCDQEVFGDAVKSLILWTGERTVTAEEVARVLGDPDEILKKTEHEETWIYHWLGRHGPNTYSSHTPLRMVDRVCKGLGERI